MDYYKHKLNLFFVSVNVMYKHKKMNLENHKLLIMFADLESNNKQ